MEQPIYAVMVAGGCGSRMQADLPKQFLQMGDKPVIIHTAKPFLQMKQIAMLLIAVPEEWVAYTEELFERYYQEYRAKYEIICGGQTRQETLMRSIDWIDKKGLLNEDTIVISHDAVRPFVTEQIIQDNIEATMKFGSANAVIPAVDTMMESKEGIIATKIPNRSTLYQVQTPQGFHALELREIYYALSAIEKENLTDASGILLSQKKQIGLTKGSVSNIKITHPIDLRLGELLLEQTAYID